MDAQGAESVGAGDADDVLDLFLDARLRGEADDLAAFCARHGVVDPEIRARLESIHAAAAPRARAAAAADEPDAERLGDFRIVRPLDQGGMGEVFLAVQESLGREVALKVMRPELRASADAEERFRREARALGRLRHPNIVSVIAVGEDRGRRFIAMELAPGRTLDDLLAETAAAGAEVDWRRAFGWARDLARALQCAHDQGIVHRDVKPSNVRIAPDDRPLLLDFGIARDESAQDAGLTRSFAGSPLYAAPEQITGAPLDGRADVYGLGATLYQCLVGRVPFAGRTLEDVMRRVLAEDPVPPRRLVPSIPRDAETVTLTALAKEPERRYATAAAFADDLDAVLSSRPIRAKPPGALGRLAKWAKRRPAPAAVVATAALALVAAGVFAVVSDRAAAADRRRRAGNAVADARAKLVAYRTRRGETETAERDAATRREIARTRHVAPSEERDLEATEGAVESFRREREVAFQEVLELLRFAERLDVDAGGAADDVRAELYRERWLEARAARDVAAQAFFRRRAQDVDRAGRFAAELRASHKLAVVTDPPGATIHLFRIREQAEVVPGGERRLVPVPPAGALWPVPPGTWTLRVVAPAGELCVGDVVTGVAGRPIEGTVLVVRGAGEVKRLDRLVSVNGAPVACAADVAEKPDGTAPERTFEFVRGDGKLGRTIAVRGAGLRALGIEVADPARCAAGGDVPAVVWRGGVSSDVVIPAGAELRTTAAPVFAYEKTAVGRAPVSDVEVEEGGWLVVAEAPGRERVVQPIEVRAGQADEPLTLTLPRVGETPRGFVVVHVKEPPERRFAFMEREVTAAEYLEFLNDDATLARIDASPTPILFPRTPDTARSGGRWPRAGKGKFSLPNWVAPDWPVFGVSWRDATDYAAWRTARAAAEGRAAETYALPTLAEWLWATGALNSPARKYAFGDRFARRWVNCCFGRSAANPAPVMSFPVDESPFGAFDTAGNVREWLDHWFDREKGLHLLASGSWALNDPELFSMWGGTGGAETAATDETGFRLVMRRTDWK